MIQKLRRESINRIRNRIKQWKKDYPAGKVTKDEIITRFRGWDAHAAHGETYALRLKYAKQVSELIGEDIKPRRKINSTNIVKQKRRMRQEQQIRRKRGEPVTSAALFQSGQQSDDMPPWM